MSESHRSVYRSLASFVRAQRAQHPEMLKYVVVGVMNTAVNAGVYNALIFSTGIAQGNSVTFFSILAFAVTIIHSFCWNKWWVFKGDAGATHRQLGTFWIVTTTTALLNTAIIHFVVNGIGAPKGIAPELWANVALAVTIPVAFLCNFFGIKFFVFRRRLGTPDTQRAE